MRKALQIVSYDIVIDTQGLLKAALVCALPNKTRDAVVSGLANATDIQDMSQRQGCSITNL